MSTLQGLMDGGGIGVVVRGIGVDEISTYIGVLQAPKRNVEAIRMIYARVIGQITESFGEMIR